MMPTWNPALFDWNESIYFRHPAFNHPEKSKENKNELADAFKVCAATSKARQSQATALTKMMYGKLGYDTEFISNDLSNVNHEAARLTFMFYKNEDLLGTYSVFLETAEGVLAERSYGKEINILREKGKSLIELSRFAIEPNIAPRISRQLHAVMLNFLGFLCQEILSKKSILFTNVDPASTRDPELIIEISPHHASFWKGLGWKIIGPERWCKRVNSASILMSESCENFADYTKLDSQKLAPGTAWKFVTRYFASSSQLEEIRQNLLQTLHRTMHHSASSKGLRGIQR